MAQLDRRLGKFDEAEASLLRAKQLSPGSLEILYNEALLYEDEGRYDDAVKVLTDSIAGLKNQAADGVDSNALAILYEQLGHAYPSSRTSRPLSTRSGRWGSSVPIRRSALGCS